MTFNVAKMHRCVPPLSVAADVRRLIPKRKTKRTENQLRDQEDMDKRAQALFVKQEQMVKREEDHLARFEKILETWENRQKLYQENLDLIEKK
jgi:hypothetical protein